MIPRPFFDRPLWTDPLWWFGIVGGLLGSVIDGLRSDLGPEDFAWRMFTGVVGFTLAAGLLLSTIRFHYRRRRDSRRTQEPRGA